MADLVVVHRDATLVIATVANLQINVWSDAPVVEQMRIFGRAAGALRRGHPRGAALLNAVRSGTPRFSEGVRDEARRLTAEGNFRLAVAHLVTVGGLAGGAARAFFSTVILLGRPKQPTRVFGESRKAAEWLAPLASGGAATWSADEVVAAYEKVLR